MLWRRRGQQRAASDASAAAAHRHQDRAHLGVRILHRHAADLHAAHDDTLRAVRAHVARLSAVATSPTRSIGAGARRRCGAPHDVVERHALGIDPLDRRIGAKPGELPLGEAARRALHRRSAPSRSRSAAQVRADLAVADAAQRRQLGAVAALPEGAHLVDQARRRPCAGSARRGARRARGAVQARGRSTRIGSSAARKPCSACQALIGRPVSSHTSTARMSRTRSCGCRRAAAAGSRPAEACVQRAGLGVFERRRRRAQRRVARRRRRTVRSAGP